MSSTRLSPSTVSNSSMPTTNPNYSFASIPTLRRASRPGNIPLPLLDPSNNHTDPAAMFYVKPSHIPHPPSSASFLPQPTYSTHFNNHLQTMSPHHHHPHPHHHHQPPLTALPMSNHDPHPTYSHPSPHFHHTPRTFPLPNSLNHHGQVYFQFPPVVTSQSSTPPHRTLPRLDDSSSSAWSNPVLSQLMVKRMNETSQAMHLDDDDDDDPSASIDALVADEQSNSSEMLDDSHRKSIDPSNPNPTIGAISPYLRHPSHMLTTPPNPLASDDHPDHQNFGQNFAPILSAGFEQSAGRSEAKGSGYFTFDEQTSPMKYPPFTEEKRSIPRMHDDNSNHSSSNSSGTKDAKSANSHGKHACTYPECTKVFANKSALAKHKLTHSQDRKHKCPTCHKGFKRLDHLSGHMLTHKDEKPHKCRVPNCSRTYCDARSLKRHIENTHQEILSAIFEGGHEQFKTYLPDSAAVKVKDATATNDASTDPNDANSPHSLIDPTRNVAVYTYDEEKCVACQICQKTFRSGAALNGHMRLHGGFTEGGVKPPPIEIEKKVKRSSMPKRPRLRSPSHQPMKLEKFDPHPHPPMINKVEPTAGRILDIANPRPPSNLSGVQSLSITPELISQILQSASRLPLAIPSAPSPASGGFSPEIAPAQPIALVKVERTDRTNIGELKIPTPTKSDSSSSATSTDQTFLFDVPPARHEPTPSPFIYPKHSQFRRQASLNAASQLLLNPLPDVPYTPPPMLSPFRRGHGLYYRVFSHPGSTDCEIPLVSTPTTDDTSEAKINLGPEYQAAIPKLRTGPCTTIREDELLFSPDHLPHLDETALDKFENLHRAQSSLFSPRPSPRTYSLELIYMLLFEYEGDLQRTIRTLLRGVADDIRPCRPLHRYHFPESDQWTTNEIDDFGKASQSPERDFGLISRAVRTKTVKQCIEFYYMPKVSVHARRTNGKGLSSMVTRRKRTELLRKEHQKRSFNDEDNSSSSFNDSRMDDDSPGDSFLVNQYTCDREECGQTFTSDRAWRAHRKEHAPSPTTKTVKFR